MKQLAFFILRWMIRPAYLEDIEGDLNECYREWTSQYSKTKADQLLLFEVLKLIRWPLIGHDSKKTNSNFFAMIFNYIKVSLRNLLKYKQSNFLNIVSLAFGLACCIVCYLHIRYELEFDKHHTNYNSIYRMVAGNPNESEFWTKVAAPMPSAFKNQIPEIKDYVRFHSVFNSPKVMVQYETKLFLEPYFMWTDPSFFNVFTFKTLQGDPVKTLQDLNSVVITESIAKKLFGNDIALGKVIKLKERDGYDFQVGAVIEDPSPQSHFRFDYLISFENLDKILGEGHSTSWGAFNYYAYLLLNDQAKLAETQQKVQTVKLSLPDSRQQAFEQIHLQPLKDIHFQHSRGNQLPAYDKTYIYVFLTIALSLLAVACINYLNLSIALSIKRIKEIGVRKAVGASRVQLVFQFINEGVVTSFIALGLGLVILEALIPVVNSLFASSISTDYTDFQFLVFIMSIALVVGLLSGSYLAFYVNGYNTSAILKGGTQSSNKGLSLQRVLVFVQFSISLVLIICSFIISNQMDFLQKKNLGFNHDQIISIPISSTVTESQLEELKNQLRQSSSVIGAAASRFVPGSATWNQTTWWEGQQEPISMFVVLIDKDFLRTMEIDLIEGDLNKIEQIDNQQYIINESALQTIGWETATGRQFSPFGGGDKQAISGVVSNFNFMSLHHGIEPLVLLISDDFSLSQLFVRISGNDLMGSVRSVESIYKNVLGDTPFEFSFMDEHIDKLYASETRVRRIVSYLSIIAIFFALFGVYGLISLNIENKTKEIAIRKVLGVASKDLLMLFSKAYYKLMIVAFLISTPLVWKLMTEWLGNFSYRVEVNPAWFALAFIGVMVAITLIGIIKYASLNRVNPAQALKND